jgi:hypothetical protein
VNPRPQAKTYVGKPCSRCGAGERYVSSRHCVACQTKHLRRRLLREKAKGRARWRVKSGWAPGEHDRAERLLPSVEECACCGSRTPRNKKGAWQADHDHTTRRFRDHLCLPCNVIVGFVERHGLDMSPSVAAYLARFTEPERMKKALRLSREVRHAS